MIKMRYAVSAVLISFLEEGLIFSRLTVGWLPAAGRNIMDYTNFSSVYFSCLVDSEVDEMSEKRASRVSTTQSLSAISEDEMADDDIVDVHVTTAPDGGYGWVSTLLGLNDLEEGMILGITKL